MSSALSARSASPPDELTGAQRPRIWSVPPRASAEQGEDLVAFAGSAGLHLDPWQSWALTEASGTLADGRWAAFEVGLLVSRQNGKNAILEARELGGLYVLGEALIIHTAHEFKAAAEHFRRVRDRVEASSGLRSRVKSVTTSHGDEAIELKPTPALIIGAGGKLVQRSIKPRLRFLARSRGSGRSFSADCVVYDEAMILSDEQVGASMPTMSAVANPQLWYTASAGYRDSTQLALVRRRGMKGSDPSLAWFEWSVDLHSEFCPRAADGRITCGNPEHYSRDDPAAWALANPGLGIRISAEHIGRELRGMSPETFARERLGVGDWPADEAGWAVISEAGWDACAIPLASAGGTVPPIAVAADATPDLSAASIGIVSERRDKRLIAEIPRDGHRDGTAWVVPRLLELKKRWRPLAVVIDPQGPAAPLIDDAEKAGIEVLKPTAREVGQAFGLFYTLVADRKLAHFGADAPDLRSAVAGAETRDIGDGGHGWGRKNTSVDISPLVAVTYAAWAFNKTRRNYDPLKSIA